MLDCHVAVLLAMPMFCSSSRSLREAFPVINLAVGLSYTASPSPSPFRLMSPTDEYSSRCQDELRCWLQKPPGLLARSGDRFLSPAVRAAQAALPEAMLQKALQQADIASGRLAAKQRFLQRMQVASVDALQDWPLADCDERFRRVRRLAMSWGAGGGVVTGLAGLPGLVADVPAVIMNALAAIHRVAWCYGYDLTLPQARDTRMALTVFALASANTLAEKQQAWRALQAMQQTGDAAVRDGLERIVGRSLSRQGVTTGMQALAQRVGVNLAQRKALGVLPAVGALVGGGVNALYLHDVCDVARFACLGQRLQAQVPP